jgi:hypothetical protein
MTTVFWVAVGVMTLGALYFVLQPVFRKTGVKVPWVLVIGLPIFAAAAYVILGSPKLAADPETTPAAAGPAIAGAPGSSMPSDGKVDAVSNLVDGLAARLEENPDDGKGWLLLAQSYDHMGRSEEAQAAYAKAKALGEYNEALENATTGAAAATAPVSADNGVRVTGRVMLAPALADAVQPSDTVFIFARAEGEKGAPAAVVRKPATGWPIEFSLSDAQSMVSGVRLSNYDKVVVTARISRSGDASDPLQGMEAKSGAVDVHDGAPVELVIE